MGLNLPKYLLLNDLYFKNVCIVKNLLLLIGGSIFAYDLSDRMTGCYISYLAYSGSLFNQCISCLWSSLGRGMHKAYINFYRKNHLTRHYTNASHTHSTGSCSSHGIVLTQSATSSFISVLERSKCSFSPYQKLNIRLVLRWRTRVRGTCNYKRAILRQLQDHGPVNQPHYSDNPFYSDDCSTFHRVFPSPNIHLSICIYTWLL